MPENIAIITWWSGSGKSVLQQELEKRGWKSPLNFSTREARDDSELDNYVFLTKKQFDFKLSKGDFLENMEFNWNSYGISRFLPLLTNIAIVVDIEGREQLIKKFHADGVKYKTFFIDLDRETQVKRMRKRGDSTLQIEERIKKDLYFPTPDCILLDWLNDTDVLADIIEDSYGKV